MPSLRDWIQLKSQRGEPISVGDTKIVPETRTLTIRWPNGGFVHNRPVAIHVQRHGQTEQLEIPDPLHQVRVFQIVLSIISAIVILVLWLNRPQKGYRS